MIPWGLSIFDDQTVVIVCYVNISLFYLMAHADNHLCVIFVLSDHVSVFEPIRSQCTLSLPSKNIRKPYGLWERMCSQTFFEFHRKTQVLSLFLINL